MILPSEVEPADDKTLSLIRQSHDGQPCPTMMLPANRVSVRLIEDLVALDTPIAMTPGTYSPSLDDAWHHITNNPLKQEVDAVRNYQNPDDKRTSYVAFASTIDPDAIAREYHRLAATADKTARTERIDVLAKIKRAPLRKEYAHTYIEVCDPVDTVMPFVAAIDEFPEIRASLEIAGYDSRLLAYADDTTFDADETINRQTTTILAAMGTADIPRNERGLVMEIPMHIDEFITLLKSSNWYTRHTGAKA